MSHLPRDDRIATETSSNTPPPSGERHVFRREGDYWTLTYRRSTVHLRDAKGLGYLARLLGRPGQRIHVGELLASTSARGPGGDAAALERARLAVTKRIRTSLQRIRENHPTLAYHLSGSVRTGSFCMYTPDPDDASTWEL